MKRLGSDIGISICENLIRLKVTKSDVCFLTRNPDVGGGGKVLSTFLPMTKKQKEDIGAKLRILLSSLISHTLTKGIFQCFDRSAANDVRVASCSLDFGPKKGARESSSRVQF